MAHIVINGQHYSGDRVEVRGNVVLIDGQAAETVKGVKILEVRVVEGVLGNLVADGSVTCWNVRGNVTAGSHVNCDDVGGHVSAGGSVNCDDVGGNVLAGGSVMRS